MSKLRLLIQATPSDTWKQKTLDPSKTYIIHEGKPYEVAQDDFYDTYIGLIQIMLNTLPEVSK
jgi:hypothetical protein